MVIGKCATRGQPSRHRAVCEPVKFSSVVRWPQNIHIYRYTCHLLYNMMPVSDLLTTPAFIFRCLIFDSCSRITCFAPRSAETFTKVQSILGSPFALSLMNSRLPLVTVEHASDLRGLIQHLLNPPNEINSFFLLKFRLSEEKSQKQLTSVCCHQNNMIDVLIFFLCGDLSLIITFDLARMLLWDLGTRKKI